MNSEIIKFVAGGGKTTYAEEILRKNEKGLYLAYTKSIINEIKTRGYICKTIDSLFQSYIIPKLLLLMPLIARGAKIEKLESSNNYQNLNTRNIWMDEEGNFYNRKKQVNITIYNTNEELYQKRFVNDSSIKMIFGKEKLKITDEMRSNIANFLLRNHGLKIIDILKSRFNYIIIDEAQDLSGYREKFVKMLYNSEIPIIIMGDPNQNICNGGEWFENIKPTSNRNLSYRCHENLCKWIRDNLKIDIIGIKNEKEYNYLIIENKDVMKYDDGETTLLYDSNRGKNKTIIENWKGEKSTIKSAKGSTINNNIIILGKSLNVKNLYTAITRTKKNAFSTIKKIN